MESKMRSEHKSFSYNHEGLRKRIAAWTRRIGGASLRIKIGKDWFEFEISTPLAFLLTFVLLLAIAPTTASQLIGLMGSENLLRVIEMIWGS